MKSKSDILIECGVRYSDFIFTDTMRAIETAMDMHTAQVIGAYKDNADKMAQGAVSAMENIDIFACGFLVFALNDPRAQAMMKSGAPPGKILDFYKDRAYVDPDTSKQ